jgi:cystathionine beta-lyase
MADIWMDEGALARRHSVKYRRYPADVLPMWVAEMDTRLADPVKCALAKAVADSDTGYADPNGLLEAFAGFAERRYGWSPDPAWMLMMPDVMTGIGEMLKLVTEPGDAVAITTPSYPPFFQRTEEIGRRIAENPLVLTARGWELDFAHLESVFAAGASAYLLCNPHNPTGKVFTRAELTTIADLADRYGVRVIADEIHAPLTFGGVAHVPFALLDHPAARASVTMVSASKAWNLAGLKCAVLVAGERGWADAQRISEDVPYGASLLGVLANQAAFEAGDAWLTSVGGALDGNRRLAAALLRELAPEVGYRMPEATYLAWLDFRRTGLGSDPATVLIERGRVALSRGTDFGDSGAGFARLNLASAPERVAEAVRRIAAVVAATQP